MLIEFEKVLQVFTLGVSDHYQIGAYVCIRVNIAAMPVYRHLSSCGEKKEPMPLSAQRKVVFTTQNACHNCA